MRYTQDSGDREFRSIEEIRAAFYPDSAWLVDLPADAIIAWLAPEAKAAAAGGRK